jgi:hypothetical protein
MHKAVKGVAPALVIALAGVMAWGVVGAQRDPGTATSSARQQHWAAWGGTVGVRWNQELAAELGLGLSAPQRALPERGWEGDDVFPLREAGGLHFDVRNNSVQRLIGGELQSTGGYVLQTRGGPIDITAFRLVPRPERGAYPVLDLIGADGQAWFYIDRLMYELIAADTQLAVRTMDLRITPALARRLGHPEVADWAIADLNIVTQIIRQGDNEIQPFNPRKWAGTPVPGVPGAVFEADLFMSAMFAQYSRCDGCTGPGGNGRVVITPSATLRNNVNHGSLQPTVPVDPLGTSSALYTADIPWYNKFSGPFPPHNNDQHPYLLWNLYRLNADGTLDQIGRSGIKHAFLTINSGCLDNPGSSNILGRGCVDVYSVGNNDSNNSLGPRSELIPATGQWGRCGSIYDTNCDGIANPTPNTSYDQRLVVRESQFSGPAQAGATFLFEAWYVARDDINVLNSMATKRVTFSRPSTIWVVGGNDEYRLGPAIDRWVDPAATGPNARNVMLSTAEGQVKVAVKVTPVGPRRWRYDYAVMNLDFARAQTSGAEPNLRVLSNRGFSGFELPVGAATITDLAFSDGDLDAANDWSARIEGGRLRWDAPAGHSLDWGTMFRFSFVADREPRTSPVLLNVAMPGLPASLKTPVLPAPWVRPRERVE